MPHCIHQFVEDDSYSASFPDGSPPIIFISTGGKRGGV
jgi:hypothetical protein